MPTTRPRPDPKIPDHVVLRRIGGGAYGEVWLARAVTGALRAVKVVWREDFEDERSFEREFEGILKYEPISRDHPGLVNILHVGRSPGEGDFYYYVMELGDDIVSGRDINEIEYEARTLSSDIRRAGDKRLDTRFCLEVGLRLSEALKHLHDHGLAHRDVKPANVIFVGGKAKLADIGLVAVRGQRTFVGTEGFVPPEGPGSAQADVYSLGKVLYEMATGKDRLDFPELPDELPPARDRKQWLALNQVICEICEPHASRRTIRSAGDLAIALAKLREGKRRRRRRPLGAWAGSFAVGGLLVWGGWEVVREGPWSAAGVARVPGVELQEDTAPAEGVGRMILVKVSSTPVDADVIDVSHAASGLVKVIGTTPLEMDRPSGETISLRLQKDGYQPLEKTFTVPEQATDFVYLVPDTELQRFAPPTRHEPWTDHLGIEYQPRGEGHESLDFLGEGAWQAYREARLAEQAPEPVGEVVTRKHEGRSLATLLTSREQAEQLCTWLWRSGIAAGFLTEDYDVSPLFPEKYQHPDGFQGDKNLLPFRIQVGEIPYGRLIVSTRPEGAEVYVNGLSQGSGSWPLVIDEVRPGLVEVLASREGFTTESRTIELEPRATEEVVIELKENKSVVMDRPWENSLGMRLVPVGEALMASVWETRVADFRAYAEDAGVMMPAGPDALPGQLKDAERHPVVSVSREQAEAFCRWLTEKERGEDRLGPSLGYRLPSDLEWTALAGDHDVEDASPAKRDRLKPGKFFWGIEWPPLEPVGNLADEASGLSLSRRVPGYVDGFALTAPVGSFPPSAKWGLHDLCGNAQEWVSDAYSPSASTGVLRGGGWKTYQEGSLYVGARNPQPPTASESTYGFRVVLAAEPEPEPEWFEMFPFESLDEE